MMKNNVIEVRADVIAVWLSLIFTIRIIAIHTVRTEHTMPYIHDDTQTYGFHKISFDAKKIICHKKTVIHSFSK